ncbi:MAG: DNA gyrase/topoisomerase IV subunit A [Bacteroidales bacterium]|nr:DNA gyrase/topoisomerase IV subunit A [Bacteroidales bacterium]
MDRDNENLYEEALENENIDLSDVSTEYDVFERQMDEDAQKFKLSGMFRDWYLDYGSYVILHRAVPHIVDGLKPVQRRVLHAMFNMDDGNYTKVANIVGQAMQYHPHGDASILGALVTLGQKGFTVDCQGNWGNILTGDTNAAPRYIEARLSKFAKEVVFDKAITHYMKSYDGRNDEPTELPVRFPLLLAQGTDGIGVGLSSKILPHNFNELIDASIAILEGKDYELYPDFPTGGYCDCSRYLDGKRGGVVKVRAKIEKIDKDTISITQLPYGKTTHLIIDSILKAKEKGKIKIKKIEDMTTDSVEILIHLPSDVSPDKTIDALYACTDCETSISPNACVIVENKPQFLSVKDILEYSTLHTKSLLLAQLNVRLNALQNEWHYLSLEKIFFENRVYKILEQDQKDWDSQINDVFKKMREYTSLLKKEVTMEDVLKLVEKPVRKISKFDVKSVEDKIAGIEQELLTVQNNIDNITGYTIEWFSSLKKKYGKDFPRRTILTGFESISEAKVISNNEKLFVNLSEGFIGTGLKQDEGVQYICDCSDLSEVIAIRKDGKYTVRKVKEKDFFGKDLLYAGVFNRGDDRTIYNVIYREGKTSVYYAKRFAISSVIRDHEYDITTGNDGSQIVWFSANHNGEAETVKVQLRPRARLKRNSFEYDFSKLTIKGKSSRGNLVTKNPISKIVQKSAGVSTISGKDIWYDSDIQKLNDEHRGLYLGSFGTNEKVLAIFANGTYYTTSFDVSNRYQGDLLQICKLDPDKIYTALYYDGTAQDWYVKRFSFVPSDNTPASFISEGPNSHLVALSEDLHPRYQVTFGGKSEHREPEIIVAEEWIAKKGIAAKGKKCHEREIKKVEFIEPLHKPEDDLLQEDVFEVINNGSTDIPLGEEFDKEPTLF